MKVKRVVANFAAKDLEQARVFYQEILGLDLLMDHGWIQTYGSHTQMTIQLSFVRARYRTLGCQAIFRS